MFQQIRQKNDQPVSSLIQPQLEIGREDDEHEKEANHFADKVMKMPDPESQKMPLGEKIGMMTDTPAIRKMSDGNTGGIMASQNVEHGINSSKGAGQSLPDGTQQELGGKLGADLSNVNIHTDSNAVKMNREIGAKAFTHGNDIYFNQGQYNPSSGEGKHLLAHELTHTIQQGKAVQRMIQKESIKPAGGSTPYLPKESGLETDMLAKSSEERKAFIETFLMEVFPVWKVLKTEGLWDKLKTVESSVKDKAVTDAIEPVPASNQLVDDGKKVLTQYPNMATRFSIGDNPKTGEDLLEEQLKKEKKEIDDTDYADLNNPAIIINQQAQNAQLTSAAIMSLRNIQVSANRLYAAWLAAKDANVDYSLSDVLAIYQQEGNKEMPSSAASLKNNIPTGVTNSVSSVGYGSDKIEISGGVLILNPNFYLPDKKVNVKDMTEERLKFFALRLYVNHIGGLDVVHQHDNVASLGKWSFDTLKALGKVKNTTEDPNAESLALQAAKTKWSGMRDNLQIIKKKGAYIIAPADPVSFVKDIMVETMLYLRKYSDIKRIFGDTDLTGSAIPGTIPMSLTYMQFNSSDVTKSERPKELVTSVVKAAKKYTGADRFVALRAEAALITTVNNTEVKKWLLGEAPYAGKNSGQRWQMVMDFIEHAGYGDWGANWAKMRGNASLVRTQSEFYKIVFGE